MIRANEVSAFDLDDIDDKGKLVVVNEEDDGDDELPSRLPDGFARRKQLSRRPVGGAQQ